MMTKSIISQSRKLRSVILFGALIAIAGAYAYERLMLVPQWSNAWNQIKALDDDPLSGAITNADVREMFGREPSRVDDSRSDFVVETYTWRRGLLVNTYDIHVIFAKFATSDKRFFYSAAAGQQPTAENFPKSKPMAVNLNPPPIVMAR